MKQWLLAIWSNFTCADNIVKNIFEIIGIVVAIIGLYYVIKEARKVVSSLEKFRQKQDEAVWNFHSNFLAFIQQLKLLIDYRRDSYSRIMDFFYEPLPDKTESGDSSHDEKMVIHFRETAQRFLKYFSTANGQVPPTIDIDRWVEERNGLIAFLNNASLIGIKKSYSKDTIKEKLSEINNILENREKEIIKIMKEQIPK